MTCDSELIVGYLYEELSPAERQSVERHLASCSACRAEVEGLRGTRAALTAWTPPAHDLGFEIVRRPTVVSDRVRPFRVSPAWGLAAAAVLVLAVGAAIANVEMQVGGDGLVIRTGWTRSTQPAESPREATAVQPAAAPTAADLAALTRRLREIETALAARPASPAPAAVSTSVPQSDLLRQVRLLIAESEKRQQGELAVLIGQVHRDVDAARRADFARLQQGLAQVQGLNDAQVLWQRQVEDRLLRVVQQQR
jgi:hypothetical protein